jgi:predicted small lipoprotein YifL
MSKRVTDARLPHVERASRKPVVSGGLLIASLALALPGCGQTGPLYLPDDPGKVIIREAGDASGAPAAQPAPMQPSAVRPATSQTPPATASPR